jgi:hypothetical protein
LAGSENRFERAQLLSAAFDPIIDICMRLGVNTGELESLLRVEFVRRAAAMLPKNPKTGKEPSHEEVGLAAGLNRGEVQKIRSARRGRKSAQVRMSKKSRQVSKSSRLLETWKTDPHFMNTSGGPLSLPIDRQLSGPSFEELVDKALPDNRHATVLKDLRRRGLVQVLPDDIVRIRRVAPSLPTTLNAQSLSYIAQQMRMLGETLLQTIEGPDGQGPDALALFASSEPVTIPAEGLEGVRAALQEQLANFVQGFEKDFSPKSRSKKTKGRKLTIGTSVYTFSNR